MLPSARITPVLAPGQNLSAVRGFYMKLSARIQSLTSSPIRKLSPYADAAKAKGKKIYHLNIGQPDIKTPDQFMESIRTYDEQVIAYGNSKGEGF